jgi:hypothetical protein
VRFKIKPGFFNTGVLDGILLKEIEKEVQEEL